MNFVLYKSKILEIKNKKPKSIPKDTKKGQPSYISQKKKKSKNHGHKYNIKF